MPNHTNSLLLIQAKVEKRKHQRDVSGIYERSTTAHYSANKKKKHKSNNISRSKSNNENKNSEDDSSNMNGKLLF